MDFSLNEEQRLLKESAERFIEHEYAFARRREIAAGGDGFSRRNWARFAELGWLGMPFSEADGGHGGTPVETMILAESFGRALVLEPFLTSVVLCGRLLTLAGGDRQKATILPPLIDGSLLPAFAHAEPRSRYDLAEVTTTARLDGRGFVIDGTKCVVFNGAAADRLIVSARTAGSPRDRHGITLFIVDGGADGVSRRGYPTVDGRRAADIGFSGVRVGGDAVLGEVDHALPVIENAVDHATAALCAEAVGAMQTAHDTTLEYIKTRRQFGRAIGSFQVVQHRMVDMFLALEEARSMAYVATLKLGDDDAARAVSAAKVQVGRSAQFVGRQAVQLHGGIGMADETAISHYFRRLTMIDTEFGDIDHHLGRFTDLQQ